MDKEMEEKIRSLKFQNQKVLQEIENEYTNDFMKTISEALSLNSTQEKRLSRYLKDNYSKRIKEIWNLQSGQA